MLPLIINEEYVSAINLVGHGEGTYKRAKLLLESNIYRISIFIPFSEEYITNSDVNMPSISKLFRLLSQFSHYKIRYFWDINTPLQNLGNDENSFLCNIFFRPPIEEELLQNRKILFVADLSRNHSEYYANFARNHFMLVNVEDKKDLCDFHIPSVVRRENLLFTISTGGKSPFLAVFLKKRLSQIFDTNWANKLEEISEYRNQLRGEGKSFRDIILLCKEFVKERNW